VVVSARSWTVRHLLPAFTVRARAEWSLTANNGQVADELGGAAVAAAAAALAREKDPE